MKKMIAVIAIGLWGCVSTPVVNQADLSKVNFSDLKSQKMGISCDIIALGVLPLESYASVVKAAWEAGIEKVSYVEYYHINAWPLLYKDCVMVYGK